MNERYQKTGAYDYENDIANFRSDLEWMSDCEFLFRLVEELNRHNDYYVCQIEQLKQRVTDLEKAGKK